MLQSESQTYGVLYSDYFQAVNRFCMTRISENKTQIIIHSYLNYVKRPSYFARSIFLCYYYRMACYVNIYKGGIPKIRVEKQKRTNF